MNVFTYAVLCSILSKLYFLANPGVSLNDMSTQYSHQPLLKETFFFFFYHLKLFPEVFMNFL